MMKVMYGEPGSASCVAHASTEEPRSASSGASSESLYALLHDSLVKVITMAGWPIWYTSGGGGASPNNRECHFAESKLKWCARIDFRRSIQDDDLRNVKWAEMLAHLPGYADVLAKQQNSLSVEGRGNAMEMAVGLAYTCHTRFVNLPEGHRVEAPGSASAAEPSWDAMRLVWAHM